MSGPEIEYRVLNPPTQRNVQQQLLSGASRAHIARAVPSSYTPALSELGICNSRCTWCLRSCLRLGVPRATHRHSYTAVFGLPPVFCVLCLWLSASLCVNAHVNVTSQVHVISNLARVTQTTAHGFRVAAHDQLLELSSPCGYQVAAFTLLSPRVNSARTIKTLHLPHWMRRCVYTAAHGSSTPRARPCACDCAWTAPGTQIP